MRVKKGEMEGWRDSVEQNLTVRGKIMGCKTNSAGASSTLCISV
jgi:hypothetical protein